MIKVLQNWSELGRMYQTLTSLDLQPHFVAQKNFDFYFLHQLVNPMRRTAKLVDLGCGDAGTLVFLQTLGFTDLHGIDLTITTATRTRQLVRMARSRRLAVPYHLYQGDLTNTPFPAASFDAGICISTIEHGVPLPQFFAEAKRILKPNAWLLVTTDYWEPKITLPPSAVADGLPWKISCKADVEELVRLGKAAGFSLLQDDPIPPCGEPCVSWSNQRYTFVLLIFRRDA